MTTSRRHRSHNHQGTESRDRVLTLIAIGGNTMNSIIYLVGFVVVILAVASLVGIA